MIDEALTPAAGARRLPAGHLALWGGHECTVNRVGDDWRDQTRLSGHEDRIEDLDRFADLGLQALRYPVLWERTEIKRDAYDWSWADARLSRLRELKVQPILGLLHHGSGPAWTNLLDPAFPEALAVFAGRVAARYPWARDWTPINEPLTTARFSALYGHWHPHLKNETAFWTAVLNQIDGIRLSMAAIRAVNPEARLIQTEDFGRTYATPPCAAQADHDNMRRFATWDLLAGRVVSGHALFDHIDRLGLVDRLEVLAADPTDFVIGLNHYATSDRFLDHRLERYPQHLHGGNGHVAYADVEAVRVVDPAPVGWSEHLRALWRRYRLPIAITECHLGCTREEQVRWLSECWDAALQARANGVDVEAVTVWNLLGGFDWNSLLTRPDGVYESGVFDLSDGDLRPTALAQIVRDLARTGGTDCPFAHEPGWWRRPGRLAYPVHPVAEEGAPPVRRPANRPILLNSADIGEQWRELWSECEQRGLHVVHPDEPGDAAPWLEVRTFDRASPLSRAFDLLLDQPWPDSAKAHEPSTYSAPRSRPHRGLSLQSWKGQP
ncbi:hypothetical protein [Brevundimonas sp. PAMC22021]|uniref:hypothetical protein n=1 Tax=Brevundimonas sp. PAMC22021 TaxID=2861285 RepID=UPI001C6274A8|nr:hypothetical protein [Brevundimonas sp. PAMC22021]QYF87824.1 hypothetical protein KY493_04850 [Brevundimonas sp. PAMC22021]